MIGLAAGLAALGDGDEEYLFLTIPGHDAWLEPYLGGPCRSIAQESLAPRHGLGARIAWQFKARAPGFLRRNWPPPTAGHEAGLAAGALSPSDGTIESAGADVMHFPLAGGFLTRVPSIYQPHDLQHLHYPEFFSDDVLAQRAFVYRTYCEEASLIVMMTSWGKRDLVAQFGLDADKVAVIPGGSVISSYPDPSEDQVLAERNRLGLPPRFLLYPAQTWEHKNHIRLLEAIAVLRDRDGIDVALVCPGRKLEFFETIAARVDELRLGDRVFFPGFVSPLQLRSLFKLATGLVFPSLFEGWGLPLTEAFETDLPVAASSATGNPDVVHDAGLIFDPEDVEQIANAVARLWTEPDLRR
ncbi:MAG: hypothetical protein QOD60_1047, partial [Solirubrobacterales bacterium]|nr:hypothetical protein [Solirubrobacterales bacterium]